ncbi:zinc finger protein 271-like [Armigeres subalbatus]|uniref:zinc finger protein 271-like n=1 Tax=Armigeres subalbatus TaxID=124917 RepID=UPI002ED60746
MLPTSTDKADYLLPAMDGFENLCRICLTGGNVEMDFLLINIFEAGNHETTSEFVIAESLEKICGLKLSENDAFPKNICSVCLCRLEEAHKLRQLSLTSQDALCDMLSKELITGVSPEQHVSEPVEDAIEYLDDHETYLVEVVEDDENDIKIEEVEVAEWTDKVHCCGCDATFETELQLRKHSVHAHRPNAKKDASETEVRCNVCYTQFSNQMEVIAHKSGKNNVQSLKKCEFCGCNFVSDNGLTNHSDVFHKDRRYKCCICSFSCYVKDELYDHAICHNTDANITEKKKRHRCTVCMSSFKTHREKRLHERFPYRQLRRGRVEKDQEVTVTVIRCCGCAKVFTLMSELCNHQEQEHLPNRVDPSEEYPLECGGCYKRFKNNSFLNKHLKRAADKKLFACSKCSVTRRSLAELIEHEASHTGKNAFSCCGCRKQFESKELLDLHSQQEHANKPKVYYNDEEDTERPFECNICYRRYKTIRDLRGHQRFVYYDKVHVCDICGKSFVQEHSLVVHIATHKTKAEFPCPICGKKYKHKSKVRNCVVQHERPKQHKCKICNVSFPAASNLYSHMISHSEDRRHKCDVCGQTYKRSFHLRKHMNSHTTEKYFACKYCSSKFSTTTELYKHEIRHTGLYPYECDICDKKLTTRQVLIKHYESHMDDSDKVFVCQLCPEKFSRDHFLSNHIKYKHRLEPQDKQWNDKFNRKGPNRLRGGRRLPGVRGQLKVDDSSQDEEMNDDTDVVERIEIVEEVETRVIQ